MTLVIVPKQSLPTDSTNTTLTKIFIVCLSGGVSTERTTKHTMGKQ